MPKLNMQGSTPIGPPLCSKCRWAQKLGGFKVSEEQIRCDYFGRIPFLIYSCSRFVEVGQLSIQEMDGIAWILMKDKKTGRIGFQSAEELMKQGKFSPTPIK